MTESFVIPYPKKAVEQGIRAQCLLCRKALGKEESGRRHVAQACRL